MKVFIALAFLAVVSAIPRPEIHPVKVPHIPGLQHHQQPPENGNDQIDEIEDGGVSEPGPQYIFGPDEISDLIEKAKKIRALLEKLIKNKLRPGNNNDWDDTEVSSERNPVDLDNGDEDENIPTGRPQIEGQDIVSIPSNGSNLEASSPPPEPVTSDDGIRVINVLNRSNENALGDVNNVPTNRISLNRGIVTPDYVSVSPVVLSGITNEPEENDSENEGSEEEENEQTEESVELPHYQGRFPNIRDIEPWPLKDVYHLPRPHFRIPNLLH